jgi:hypothetical protein
MPFIEDSVLIVKTIQSNLISLIKLIPKKKEKPKPVVRESVKVQVDII